MMNLVKYKILFCLILIFTGGACSETNQQQKQAEKSNKKQTAKEKPKKLLPRFTPSNAPKMLQDYAENHSETIVLLTTTMGNIKIKLYEGTPMHRANFLMLSKRKYFEETVFHRVIKDFMVQGGGSDDWATFRAKQRAIGKYKIPSEIQPKKYFHKRGAVAMAREYENNPEQLSSTYDFYIVQAGKKITLPELEQTAKENNLNLTPEQIQVYTTQGGAPHLDGLHTVFGEVLEGMDVVDKIANVPVGEKDHWPIENIMVTKVEVLE